MYVVASNFVSWSVVILLGLLVDELHQQSCGRIVRLMLYLSHPILSLPQSRSVPAVRRAGHLPKSGRRHSLAPSHARPNPLDTTFASLPKKFALLVHSLPLAEYLVVLVHDDCAVVKKILLVYSHCLPPLYVAHVQRQ